LRRAPAVDAVDQQFHRERNLPRRFERFADPCGHWTVWDKMADVPATDQGYAPAGLAPDDARKLSTLLNLMHEAECAAEAEMGNRRSQGGREGAA
jgi:hypothetical protein